MRSHEIVCRSFLVDLEMPRPFNSISADFCAASGVWKRSDEPDWIAARWKRPFAAGVPIRHDVFDPPPDWPKIITRLGSPPKLEMLSFTHCSEATISMTPTLPALAYSAGAPAAATR